MTRRHVSLAAATLLLVMFVFFDISLNPVFELPRDVERPERVQEQRYADCVAARDEAIHRRAFDTIDNPDVQREYISAHRETARAECRERYPEQLVTVRLPLRFNLVDLAPRFASGHRY